MTDERLREGFIPKDEVFLFSPNARGLNKDVRVGKVAGYPDQIIIGKPGTIKDVVEALKLLDDFDSDRVHRTMHIVVSCSLDPETGSIKPNTPPDNPYTLELLERYRVYDGLLRTTFRKKDPAYSDRGVTSSIQVPVYRTPDYSDFYKSKISKSSIIILWASYLRHEATHIKQTREGLLGSSLWKEREAISLQARFLFQILASGYVPSLDQGYLFNAIDFLSKAVEKYRNGTPIKGHKVNLENSGRHSLQTNREPEDFGIEMSSRPINIR